MTRKQDVAHVLNLDLVGEMHRDSEHNKFLMECGVPSVTTVRYGKAQIEHDDKFYQPIEGGESAVIVPVEDGGVLVDLLAFHPDEPDKWWLRKGTHWALGGDALEWLWMGTRLAVYGWLDLTY